MIKVVLEVGNYTVQSYLERYDKQKVDNIINTWKKRYRLKDKIWKIYLELQNK